MYDFDELIDRSGSGCSKLSELDNVFGRHDLLPMWIADMDFRTPDFIIDAIRQRLEHPVFGYTAIPENYFDIISRWVRNLHNWDVGTECFRYIPGIVKGIGMVIDAFLKPGDKVLIQPPVYHPFRLVPQRKGVGVVYNPLLPVYDDGVGMPCDMTGKDCDRHLISYRMDFDGLETLLASDPSVKLMILSNPHNPAGICWSRETLVRLSDITSKYGVMVISDEIHAEMVLDGRVHIPYASVSKAAENNSITFMAPSKTFNIAGIVTSYAIVRDPELRDRFFGYLDSGELDAPSVFSIIATMAAYTAKGDGWRSEMLDYVSANIGFTDRWLKANLPQVRCVRPDASFLVWLDCRSLRLCQKDLVSLFVNKARVAMNDGSMFGGDACDDRRLSVTEGCGFMRMNVGCPRVTVEKALNSIRNSVLNA